MNMIESMKSSFIEFLLFTEGRSRRTDYWFYYFVSIIVCIIFKLAFNDTKSDLWNYLILAAIWPVAAPPFSILLLLFQLRRLHDINKSGWNYLWNYLPIVGPILLIVWCCRRGTVGDNRFGPDPLAPALAEAR